ncbi:hypothetical protein EDD86DRAFT_212121 [Gorgonomyces haynaldii]|nr:hypothetical protein EDD86DRAFT_212121 [Gorgonomyces haynaldii]
MQFYATPVMYDTVYPVYRRVPRRRPQRTYYLDMNDLLSFLPDEDYEYMPKQKARRSCRPYRAQTCCNPQTDDVRVSEAQRPGPQTSERKRAESNAPKRSQPVPIKKPSTPSEGSLIEKLSNQDQDAEPLLMPMDEYLASHSDASSTVSHSDEEEVEEIQVPYVRKLSLQPDEFVQISHADATNSVQSSEGAERADSVRSSEEPQQADLLETSEDPHQADPVETSEDADDEQQALDPLDFESSVKRTGNGYLLTIQCPAGITKDTLSMDLDGKYLTITESRTGYAKQFGLPDHISAQHIRAAFEDQTLKVHIDSNRSRKINIL